MTDFSHLDANGNAQMVDVSNKDITGREAIASGRVKMAPQTMAQLDDGSNPKGDVLAVARVAGIMAAKRTPELIPLCHGLPLDAVTIEFVREGDDTLMIRAICRVQARTGVEMEALTAVSVAALTVYDMCKAVDKGIVISEVRLEEKRGGRSGHWRRSA